MGNFVDAKKLVRIKEIIELWEVELQRVNCIFSLLKCASIEAYWNSWTLDSGRYTLDAGLWTLDTVVDFFRTESEPSF